MKKYFKNIRYFLPALSLATPFLARAAAQGLPIGHAITFSEIDYIMGILANFIISVAGVLMIGSIVASGIMVMTSRDNPDQFKRGQAWLRNAIWGAFIVLGTGVIINTVAALVDRSFFCQVSVVGICLWY